MARDQCGRRESAAPRAAAPFDRVAELAERPAGERGQLEAVLAPARSEHDEVLAQIGFHMPQPVAAFADALVLEEKPASSDAERVSLQPVSRV